MWLLQEDWHKVDLSEEGSERQQQHVRQGVSYAALGHEGRMPYVQRAFERRVSGPESGFSTHPNASEIPKDLLSPAERRFCDPNCSPDPIWIRTDYSYGTDEHFKDFLQAFPDHSSRLEVVQDVQRYNFPDGGLSSLVAFFPAMIEAQHIHYLEDDWPFESDVVQHALFAAYSADSLPEEDRQVHSLPHFFVADAEAMRSGFVRCVVPGQYGVPLFSEGIQPWSLMEALSLRSKRALQEFRDGIARGWYGNDPEYGDHIVRPRAPLYE